MTQEINTAKKAARELTKKYIAKGYEPEALHIYKAIDGTPIYYRIRLKNSKGNKIIRPMYQETTGKYKLGEPSFSSENGKPLYGLELLKLHPEAIVVVVEGEWVADAMNKFFFAQRNQHRYVAVTTGSATSAQSADITHLQGRDCLIWADNDQPGGRYAQEMYEQLIKLGVSTYFVDFSNLSLPEGGDFVDYLNINPNLSIDNFEALPKRKDNLMTVERSQATTRVQRNEENDEACEIESWPEPVNLSDLLGLIYCELKAYVICEDDTLIAGTLWIAMTWVLEAFDVAPLAIITAPEKRCGKSKFLTVIGKLVRRPMPLANITAPALFRVIDSYSPTLLIDEADTFMKENEDLRGLINAGYTREQAFVYRATGPGHSVEKFNVWGPKILCGIGKYADTIMDRAIILKLRRKQVSEEVHRVSRKSEANFAILRSKLLRFSQDMIDKLESSEPPLPTQLNDRAQDNWEPLLAISEMAGKEWLERATLAAVNLTQVDDATDSIQLLIDIRQVFFQKGTERLTTEDLISELCEDHEKPWLTYSRGKSITAYDLAKILREFEIKSKTIRFGEIVKKGYYLKDCVDSFLRYLSPQETLQSN